MNKKHQNLTKYIVEKKSKENPNSNKINQYQEI